MSEEDSSPSFLNRDPNRKAVLTTSMIRLAKDRGMQIINVSCYDPREESKNSDCLTFFAIVPFLPRLGDRIMLEHGMVCLVKEAVFKVVKDLDDDGKLSAVILMPNILAELLDSGSGS
jgi:hypothetical protein